MKARGRSEVLRRATALYLKRKAKTRLQEQYRRAYGGSGGLGDDWAGWQGAGEWPE